MKQVTRFPAGGGRSQEEPFANLHVIVGVNVTCWPFNKVAAVGNNVIVTVGGAIVTVVFASEVIGLLAVLTVTVTVFCKGMIGGLTLPWTVVLNVNPVTSNPIASLTVTVGSIAPNPLPVMVTPVCCPEGHTAGSTLAIVACGESVKAGFRAPQKDLSSVRHASIFVVVTVVGAVPIVNCAVLDVIGVMVPSAGGAIAVHVNALVVGLMTFAVYVVCAPGAANKSVSPVTVMLTGPVKTDALADFDGSSLLAALIRTVIGA